MMVPICALYLVYVGRIAAVWFGGFVSCDIATMIDSCLHLFNLFKKQFCAGSIELIHHALPRRVGSLFLEDLFLKCASSNAHTILQ